MHSSKYPSIKKLIETFEISYRQGQRDVEYMRDFLGAPIEYSQKNKGYFYSGSFSMPTLYLSGDEANYMKKLSDYYNSLQGDGLDEYKKYGEIFNRISSSYADNTDGISSFQIPYTAKIKILNGRHSYRILDKFLRSKSDNIFIYEFQNVEMFIGLLLSCVSDFKIIFPDWLKERVLRICRKTIENNKL
jgi:predicted DNA-binding transcriptional regulator YafY